MIKSKLFFLGILFFVFSALFIPVFGFAAGDSPVKSVNQVIKILERIVEWTYRIFFIAAVFFILMAAFKFLSAGDDSEKINQAKKQIIYAVVAIIIALLSVSFTAIIENFLGGGGPSSSEVYGPPSPSNIPSDLDSKYTPPYGDDRYGDNYNPEYGKD